MKIHKNDPPREYEVGFGPKVTIKDCAHIELADDEQVTFKTEAGGEYDVARKNWGYYATPSINGRLERFGLKTALVKNRLGQFFVMLVEQGKKGEFDRYVEDEGLTVCGWLDDHTLAGLETTLASTHAA